MTLFDNEASELYMLMQLIEVGKVSMKESEAQDCINLELTIELFKTERLREGNCFSFSCNIDKKRFLNHGDFVINRRAPELNREITRQKLSMVRDAYKRIIR